MYGQVNKKSPFFKIIFPASPDFLFSKVQKNKNPKPFCQKSSIQKTKDFRAKAKPTPPRGATQASETPRPKGVKPKPSRNLPVCSLTRTKFIISQSHIKFRSPDRTYSINTLMAVSIKPEMFAPGYFFIFLLGKVLLIFVGFIFAYDFFTYQYPMRLLKISFFLKSFCAKILD